MWPRSQGFGTYNDMVSSNKRILAFYDSGQYVNHPEFWNGNLVLQEWANVDNYEAMIPYEMNSVKDQTGDPAAIYKLQWVLTASGMQ